MKRSIITVILFFSLAISAFGQIKIGVALPLIRSNEDRTGSMMLKGIEKALKDYNSSGSGEKIILEIKDTERESGKALDVINELASDDKVIAIFGPVYSMELMGNAGAAEFHKIPVITPTATQNFLAEKNEYLFQLNPTYDIRGRSMAKFAMQELGMNNFIILSEEDYGKNFSQGFSEEVFSQKGKIIYTKYFSKFKK
jgi:branched-chain amino acid transport system substrate-binding protein